LSRTRSGFFPATLSYRPRYYETPRGAARCGRRDAGRASFGDERVSVRAHIFGTRERDPPLGRSSRAFREPAAVRALEAVRRGRVPPSRQRPHSEQCDAG
jgi:hypothetical protein